MYKKLGLIGVGLAALAIGVMFAFAGGRSGHRGMRDGGFPPAFMFERIARELNLNEDQKTQAKQILEESKTRVEPLMKTIKENRSQNKDLGTDGNFDEAKVNEIANGQAETMKQLFIEKERTKAHLFAILTPEQREKAKQMQEKFTGRMKGRFSRFPEKSGDKPTSNQK